MIKKIQNRLHALDKGRDKMYELVEHLEEKAMQTAPPNEWSLIQIFEHLMNAEAGSVAYMKKKQQAGEAMPNYSIRNQLNRHKLILLLRSNLKWKAPKVLGQPKGDMRYEEVKNNWQKVRSETKQYAMNYPHEYFSKAVFRHPLAGRMNLVGAIDSMIYHQKHHIHQIKRVIKQMKH